MNDLPFLIGITAYDRCGKDYTASRLVKDFTETYKLKTGILPFARILKDMVADFLDIEPVLLEKMKNEDILICRGYNIETTRDTIIKYASVLRNHIGDVIFVQGFDKLLKGEYSDYDVVIVPDVRFIPEEKYIHDNNGIVIRLLSDLPTCGKSGNRYEVDKLNYDLIYNNHYKSFNKKEEEYQLLKRYLYKKYKEIKANNDNPVENTD